MKGIWAGGVSPRTALAKLRLSTRSQPGRQLVAARERKQWCGLRDTSVSSVFAKVGSVFPNHGGRQGDTILHPSVFVKLFFCPSGKPSPSVTLSFSA